MIPFQQNSQPGEVQQQKQQSAAKKKKRKSMPQQKGHLNKRYILKSADSVSTAQPGTKPANSQANPSAVAVAQPQQQQVQQSDAAQPFPSPAAQQSAQVQQPHYHAHSHAHSEQKKLPPMTEMQVLELILQNEAQLVNELRKRSPVDKVISNLRRNILSLYEAILQNNFNFAVRKDIIQMLWKSVFYKPIEEFRKIIKKNQFGVENQKQNSKEKLERTLRMFQAFLKDSSKYFNSLFTTLSTYLKIHEREKVLSLMSKCLIFLGDLERYIVMYIPQQQQYSILRKKIDVPPTSVPEQQNPQPVVPQTSIKEVETSSQNPATSQPQDQQIRKKPERNWEAVKRHYISAIRVYPANGNAHNQLAVVATYEGNEFEAIYQYYRSLAVRIPFSSARENLLSFFEDNRVRYQQKKKVTKIVPIPKTSKLSKKKGESATANSQTQVKGYFKEIVKGELLGNFLLEFVRIHGILFTRISVETIESIMQEAFVDFKELLHGWGEPERKDVIDEDLGLKIVVMNIFSIHHLLNKEKEKVKLRQQQQLIQQQQQIPSTQSPPNVSNVNTEDVQIQYDSDEVDITLKFAMFLSLKMLCIMVKNSFTRSGFKYQNLSSILIFLIFLKINQQTFSKHWSQLVVQFESKLIQHLRENLLDLKEKILQDLKSVKFSEHPEISVIANHKKDIILHEEDELFGFIPLEAALGKREGTIGEKERVCEFERKRKICEIISELTATSKQELESLKLRIESELNDLDENSQQKPATDAEISKIEESKSLKEEEIIEDEFEEQEPSQERVEELEVEQKEIDANPEEFDENSEETEQIPEDADKTSLAFPPNTSLDHQNVSNSHKLDFFTEDITPAQYSNFSDSIFANNPALQALFGSNNLNQNPILGNDDKSVPAPEEEGTFLFAANSSNPAPNFGFLPNTSSVGSLHDFFNSPSTSTTTTNPFPFFNLFLQQNAASSDPNKQDLLGNSTNNQNSLFQPLSFDAEINDEDEIINDEDEDEDDFSMNDEIEGNSNLFFSNPQPQNQNPAAQNPFSFFSNSFVSAPQFPSLPFLQQQTNPQQQPEQKPNQQNPSNFFGW